MRCAFCQNAEIRHGGGTPVTPDTLGEIFLALQDRGCHNVNLVTPTHVTPQILGALHCAALKGFTLPLVWNTSGYETAETLSLLDGIVDIYLPDAKIWDETVAATLTGATGYPAALKTALSTMQAQVGDLTCTDGIATRGLIIRHLVLPEGLAGSSPLFEFIAEEGSSHTYVNIMDQYRPCHRVLSGEDLLFQRMGRPVNAAEMEEACALARKSGLFRGFSGRDSDC